MQSAKQARALIPKEAVFNDLLETFLVDFKALNGSKRTPCGLKRLVLHKIIKAVRRYKRLMIAGVFAVHWLNLKLNRRPKGNTKSINEKLAACGFLSQVNEAIQQVTGIFDRF